MGACPDLPEGRQGRYQASLLRTRYCRQASINLVWIPLSTGDRKNSGSYLQLRMETRASANLIVHLNMR